MKHNILAMIMAGGKGSRLYPLTMTRAKPAVPFGGKYRIIDFTLSNFINSGIYSIYVLTQFKSQSLTTHIRDGWTFGSGLVKDHFITTVPAQMRIGESWYKGTADSIFQNLSFIEARRPDVVAVFGADHIYRMDIRQMINYHKDAKSHITIAALPVPVEQATEFGVIQVDKNWRVIGFQEKPKNPKPIPGRPDTALISMGNYIFDTDILLNEVAKDAEMDTEHDFGRSILPKVYKKLKVHVYNFQNNRIPRVIKSERNDYWRDVGSLQAYYDAHMELLGSHPHFDLYNYYWPIRTVSYSTPPSKIVMRDSANDSVENSIISEGCIINGGRIVNSVLGRNVVIEKGAVVENSILLNNVNIGKNAQVKKVIIDKKVRVKTGEKIGYDLEKDARKYFVSETGIVAIPEAEGIPPLCRYTFGS
ncbi:MAG: glucose-1-phosphate adenylyltransferase [Armatimonadota bacterium]